MTSQPESVLDDVAAGPEGVGRHQRLGLCVHTLDEVLQYAGVGSAGVEVVGNADHRLVERDEVGGWGTSEQDRALSPRAERAVTSHSVRLTARFGVDMQRNSGWR